MERDTKENWLFGLTLGSAAATLVSIFVSELLGAIALILWIAFRPKRVHLPSYVVPLVAFMVATTLSLLMSPDPHRGIAQINKFVLFPMGLLAANFVSTPIRARLSYRVLLVVGASSALFAIGQFIFAYVRFLQTGQLDPMSSARIKGFMSHWITFSVGEMLVWCAAIPILIVLARKWILPVVVIGAGLILSFTRGVWIGSAVAFLCIAFTLPRKVLAAVFVPVAIVALIASGPIVHRLMLSFQGPFMPDENRKALLQAGVGMVRANPFFGVGPERVQYEFKNYYSGSIDPKNFYTGHMENNFMQIAAERGLITLAAFVWFLVELFRGLWRIRRDPDETVRAAALSSLAVLAAFLVAGLFSYDFGDSETMMLFFFLVSIPFGLAREEAQAVARSAAQA